MRIFVALAALLLTLTGLTACGSDGDDTVADPGASGGSTSDASAVPSEAPLPAGAVRTANLATVMDTGTPELCLGPVAESYPPQCGGPAITNWDWTTHGQEMFEEQDGTRWGTYSVTGSWDGTAFEVTDAVPGPLYDPAPLEPSATPTPEQDYSAGELEGIRTEVEQLPGAQGAYVGEGQVTVEVMYDDGSLQEWADEEYGAGVVLVTALLVDA
ncbi:hypothetical protein [Nocardioides lianchengensis]|uniref:hypothetical protein n=1 Tax=Nocardioides lianchengensis TaxID=1045774 RepID=UPI000AA3B90D|nr:hypothetical protein [Nocardioides lianchengensis]NYG11331.1 hypothetical protein [Nocardioides lianchengensis]